MDGEFPQPIKLNDHMQPEYLHVKVKGVYRFLVLPVLTRWVTRRWYNQMTWTWTWTLGCYTGEIETTIKQGTTHIKSKFRH